MANATPAHLTGEGLWSCPHCHRVTRGLFEVEYGFWLTIVGPVLRCADCVDELRSADPGDVWDVRLLRHVGAPLAALVAMPA